MVSMKEQNISPPMAGLAEKKDLSSNARAGRRSGLSSCHPELVEGSVVFQSNLNFFSHPFAPPNGWRPKAIPFPNSVAKN